MRSFWAGFVETTSLAVWGLQKAVMTASAGRQHEFLSGSEHVEHDESAKVGWRKPCHEMTLPPTGQADAHQPLPHTRVGSGEPGAKDDRVLRAIVTYNETH